MSDTGDRAMMKLRAYMAPQSSDEASMCALWEFVVLGVDRVGMTDDFFEMG